MQKNAIGASLPDDLFVEFNVRAEGFPGGKSALIRDSLRSYFEQNPLSKEQGKMLEDEGRKHAAAKEV